MRKRRNFKSMLWAVFLAALFIGGCDEDERLAQMARESAERQAEQNRAMARQNQQIAEATKELVAADAKARQELTTMQKDLRADQAQVGQQRDVLEMERQKIAAERKWDQLLAPALQDFGILLVIAAALGFCGYLLIGLRREDVTEQAVGELLIQEIVAENPILLPPAHPSQPALEHPRLPAIPAIKDCKPDSTVSKR
jgi:hypothetical protein